MLDEAPTPPASATTVAVLEDYPSTAEGLLQGLVAAGFRVIEPAPMVSVTQLDDAPRPDVVLCDLHLGQAPVLDTITALVHRALKILAISGPATREEILNTVAAGAQGFVHKREATQTICAAAQRVANGECWIGAQLAGHLLADAHVRPLRRDELTETDFGVLRALAQGRSDQEVADLCDVPAGRLPAVYARIIDAGRRRRPLRQPSPRELEAIRLVGALGLTKGQAAARLEISLGTFNEYMQDMKKKYIDTHPGTRPDITPIVAAQRWAATLGLTDPDGDKGDPERDEGL